MFDISQLIPEKIFSLEVFHSAVDILVLSLIFFSLLRVFHAFETRFLLNLALTIVLVYAAAVFLQLNTVLWVFKNIFGWVIFAALVIFQPELRTLVSRMRTGFSFNIKKNKELFSDISQVEEALEFLLRARRGGLFVFPRYVSIESFISGETELHSLLRARILETIFSHDTPLHDGAVIIKEGKIRYAGCYLPMRKDLNIPQELGSRHRAAISLAKSSDAIVIIVSEENNCISVAAGTQLYYDIPARKACALVSKLLRNEAPGVFWTKEGIQERLSAPLEVEETPRSLVS